MAGFGDLVYFVFKYTGIKAVHDFIYYKIMGNIDCGCEFRRRWLNEKFPFRRSRGD